MDCLHCQRSFEPRRPGHIFCSNRCRYAHRTDDADFNVDPDAIERLFDDRDDGDRVAPDEWHPGRGLENGEAAAELDCWDTLGTRRQWYLNLVGEGR